MSGAHTYFDAEVEELVRLLRSYGVLTRERLEELSHADRWREADFTLALHAGIRRGEIRHLGADLYELGPAGR